jgi:hypothetical protein
MGDMLGKVAGSVAYRIAEMVAGTEGRLGILKTYVTNTITATISGVIDVDATGQGDVPITLGGEEVEVTLNGEEVEVTLNSETVEVVQDTAADLKATVTQAAAVVLGASSVNIGDVDVLTLPAAVQGPGNPTIDSYNTAVINAAAAADQELVATPGANKQIWVYGLFMMADTAAGTVTLQDEDDTALSGTMAVSDEGGWVLPISGNFGMPWIKVTTNKALEADCVNCTVDGIICYAIVSV